MVRRKSRNDLCSALNYLKTSYVMVRLFARLIQSINQIHLKTSYVMVRPSATVVESVRSTNLKTSYVMVRLRHISTPTSFQQFKNILCYGSAFEAA